MFLLYTYTLLYCREFDFPGLLAEREAPLPPNNLQRFTSRPARAWRNVLQVLALRTVATSASTYNCTQCTRKGCVRGSSKVGSHGPWLQEIALNKAR